jgi:TPR repeat protein
LEIQSQIEHRSFWDHATVFFSLGRQIWMIQFSVHKSAQFIDPKIAFVQNDESYTVFNVDAETLGNKYLPKLDYSISQFPLTDKMFELMMSSNRVVYNIADQNYHAALNGSRDALTRAIDNLPHFLAAQDDKQHTIEQAKSDAQQAQKRAVEAVTQCDALVGYKWDQHVVGTGVGWADIDADRAIIACQNALNQDALNDDDKPRMMYQLGRAFDRAGDERALDMMQQAGLKMGYGAALFHLALLYEDGQYIAKDLEQAEHAFRAAQSMGNIPAAYKIGKILFERATSRSEQLDAERILRKSINANYPDALVYYGTALLDHKTSSLNSSWGQIYLETASDLGRADASYRLATEYRGDKYFKGDVQAYERYLRLAAEQGNKQAQQEMSEW